MSNKMPIPDGLHGRIAAVIYAHDCWDYAGGLECRCGSQFSFDENDPSGDAITPWSEHVADAVIAELNPDPPAPRRLWDIFAEADQADQEQ